MKTPDEEYWRRERPRYYHGGWGYGGVAPPASHSSDYMYRIQDDRNDYVPRFNTHSRCSEFGSRLPSVSYNPHLRSETYSTSDHYRSSRNPDSYQRSNTPNEHFQRSQDNEYYQRSSDGYTRTPSRHRGSDPYIRNRRTSGYERTSPVPMSTPPTPGSYSEVIENPMFDGERDRERKERERHNESRQYRMGTPVGYTSSSSSSNHYNNSYAHNPYIHTYSVPPLDRTPYSDSVMAQCGGTLPRHHIHRREVAAPLATNVANLQAKATPNKLCSPQPKATPIINMPSLQGRQVPNLKPQTNVSSLAVKNVSIAPPQPETDKTETSISVPDIRQQKTISNSDTHTM